MSGRNMLLGLALLTPLALERAGSTISDLTLIQFDMHEAFAAQTLANIQLLVVNVLLVKYWACTCHWRSGR
ncbi:hypothetical protein ACLK19_15485 [Escherichia coli]